MFILNCTESAIEDKSPWNTFSRLACAQKRQKCKLFPRLLSIIVALVGGIFMSCRGRKHAFIFLSLEYRYWHIALV